MQRDSGFGLGAPENDMENMGRKALVLVGMLALGGCTTLESPNPDSPYYDYPPGWVVQLNRPLPIEPGTATTRLQFGQIVPRNSVQDAYPFCIVEVNKVSGARAQMLQPQRFEVLEVTRSVSEISASATPYPYAGFIKVGRDSPSFLYFITMFHLRPMQQSDIRNMRCAWNQMAPGNRALMRDLTLDEIRQALGDWITLIPPPGKPVKPGDSRIDPLPRQRAPSPLIESLDEQVPNGVSGVRIA
jgi:hypothetical protein